MTALENARDFVIDFVEAGDRFTAVLNGQYREAAAVMEWSKLDGMIQKLKRAMDGGGGEAELIEAGKGLFNWLFDGTSRDVLVGTTGNTRQQALRILIKLSLGSRLETVPWEILHDGFRFLAREPRCAVVRYFRSGLDVPEFQVDPPLRILITTACPQGVEAVNLESGVKAVKDAYKGFESVVKVEVVPDVSLKHLARLWSDAEKQGRPPHIWHHWGHGHVSNIGESPRFVLLLEGEGEAGLATVDQISEVVGTCPDLRMVILTVCHGSSSLGLAPELARLNVPVVVGFPEKVAVDLAESFSVEVHRSLLKIPVEFAVSHARRALRIRDLDWSQPVLISRRRDKGLILRVPPNLRTREFYDTEARERLLEALATRLDMEES